MATKLVPDMLQMAQMQDPEFDGYEPAVRAARSACIVPPVGNVAEPGSR
jgi:hypothetical protein